MYMYIYIYTLFFFSRGAAPPGLPAQVDGRADGRSPAPSLSALPASSSPSLSSVLLLAHPPPPPALHLSPAPQQAAFTLDSKQYETAQVWRAMAICSWYW